MTRKLEIKEILTMLDNDQDIRRTAITLGYSHENGLINWFKRRKLKVRYKRKYYTETIKEKIS